ncbi:MAG: hypothetical protein CM1200mP2_49440 [Planctomycetaceae bacterium]|nr:MAG: hypothetical protein CM1200mP2_49440 [Planctomycetaceae bacterium]
MRRCSRFIDQSWPNQFGGQPVEQFGGYRCGPELPEIVRGFNQPDPEVPLPERLKTTRLVRGFRHR